MKAPRTTLLSRRLMTSKNRFLCDGKARVRVNVYVTHSSFQRLEYLPPMLLPQKLLHCRKCLKLAQA